MLRNKATIILTAALAGFLLIVYAASQVILVRSFSDLEEQDTRRNVQRVQDALSDDLSSLNSQVGDWAAWDESYSFIQDANPDYIKRNLPDATYSELRLNLILFIDPAGQIVFGKTFDLAEKTTSPVPDALRHYFTGSNPLLFHSDDLRPSVAGIALLPAGPMLVAARPILTTERTGPLRGTLIMGRYLDNSEIARLAAVTHLAVSLHQPDAMAFPHDVRQAYRRLLVGKTAVVSRLGEDSIGGYGLLTDLYDRPALLLRVLNTRPIYRQGQSTIHYLMLWLLFIGLLAAIIIRLFLKKLLHSQDKRRDSEERYRAVVEQSNCGIFLADASSKCLLEANAAFLNLFDYGANDITALSLCDVLGASPEDINDVVKNMLQERRQHSMGEKRHYRSDGSHIDLEIMAELISHAGKDVLYVVIRDITKHKQAEDRILYLAHYDTLTQLPNRLLLQDRLKQNLVYAKHNHCMIALLAIGLDRFKVINDTLGHHIGDQLLRTVAERLMTCVRKGETVSRQGGDEFIVIISDIHHIENIPYIAQRILHCLSKPYVINGNELHLTASIGISLYPNDGEDIDSLMKNADIAMHQAKKEGGNNYQFFTHEMNARTFARMTLENSLRRALRQKEFFLMYQPQVSFGTGQIYGMEALLRWQHPERGLIPPLDFIPIAEETGLIVPIGKWVLRTACNQAKMWQVKGFPPLLLAVNLSARQFIQRDLAQTVAAILRRTGLGAEWLELEVTESLLMENMECAIATMHKLTDLGASFAIDDFGTGYSSLAYLKRIPVSTLKIDRSFIQEVATDAGDAAITSAIIDLAHKLHFKVVAEGVEDAQQLSVMNNLHCDAIQGYYFSRPLNVEDFTRLLQEGRQLQHNTPALIPYSAALKV